MRTVRNPKTGRTYQARRRGVSNGSIRKALDEGALGYLFKDAAHLELIEAVRAAAAGRRVRVSLDDSRPAESCRPRSH